MLSVKSRLPSSKSSRWVTLVTRMLMTVRYCGFPCCTKLPLNASGIYMTKEKKIKRQREICISWWAAIGLRIFLLDLDLSLKETSGNQGWRTGKSTCLSSMWSGFDFDLDAMCGLRLSQHWRFSLPLKPYIWYDLVWFHLIGLSRRLQQPAVSTSPDSPLVLGLQ